MRSGGNINKASTVIAMNWENHRFKKSQAVNLFIQKLVYIRRFTTRLCCNCFVQIGLSNLTAVFIKSHTMRGHGERGGRRRRSTATLSSSLGFSWIVGIEA